MNGLSDFPTKIMPFIFQQEGGVANDPDDSGGLTNMGITQKEYDSYRAKHSIALQSVKLLTQDEASEIYYTDYWLPSKADSLRYPLNLAYFDCYINTNPQQAITLLQRALEVDDDGVMGPETVNSMILASKTDGASYFACDRLIIVRAFFYHTLAVKNTTQVKFLLGEWIPRLKALYAVVNKLEVIENAN